MSDMFREEQFARIDRAFDEFETYWGTYRRRSIWRRVFGPFSEVLNFFVAFWIVSVLPLF